MARSRIDATFSLRTGPDTHSVVASIAFAKGAARFHVDVPAEEGALDEVALAVAAVAGDARVVFAVAAPAWLATRATELSGRATSVIAAAQTLAGAGSHSELPGH